MRFTSAPELSAIVRPGVLWLEDAVVVAREPRMDAPLASAEAAVRINSPASTPPCTVRAVGTPAEAASVRAMFRRVGIDPTKTRPSSEALLRRVRRGDPLPRINAMVDVCNWCSLEFQLPYGLYDAAHLEGDLELRLGRPGESYAGIRKDEVHVGGRITLADRLGPFGNPTSDSARTMVTPATTRALLVVFAPWDVEPSRLSSVMDITSSRMTAFTGCREAERWPK
jgi:DNA/RNA-binding domain of Phe-tRNA-synthetase-like protein